MAASGRCPARVMLRNTSSSPPRSTWTSVPDQPCACDRSWLTLPNTGRLCRWQDRQPHRPACARRAARPRGDRVERSRIAGRTLASSAVGTRHRDGVVIAASAPPAAAGVPSATMRPRGDDDGAGADGLDLFEDVGRDDDRLVRRHRRDQRAHLVLLVRVEPVGRLVQDQHLGIVQQRLSQADAALEALGQRLDRLVAARPRAGSCRQPGRRPSSAALPVRPRDAGDEGEEATRASCRRRAARPRAGSRAAGAPRSGGRARRGRRSWRCPSVGVRKPVIIFMVVDLPAPFGPRKPSTSPFATVRLIWSTAVIDPNRLVRPLVAIISTIRRLLLPGPSSDEPPPSGGPIAAGHLEPRRRR